MLIATQFLAAYPEFSGIDEDVITRKIDKAIAMVDPDVWGESWTVVATSLLVAHELYLARWDFLEEQQIAAGLQTGSAPKRESQNNLPYLQKSRYGMEYIEISKRLPRSGIPI